MLAKYKQWLVSSVKVSLLSSQLGGEMADVICMSVIIVSVFGWCLHAETVYMLWWPLLVQEVIS